MSWNNGRNWLFDTQNDDLNHTKFWRVSESKSTSGTNIQIQRNYWKHLFLSHDSRPLLNAILNVWKRDKKHLRNTTCGKISPRQPMLKRIARFNVCCSKQKADLLTRLVSLALKRGSKFVVVLSVNRDAGYMHTIAFTTLFIRELFVCMCVCFKCWVYKLRHVSMLLNNTWLLVG